MSKSARRPWTALLWPVAIAIILTLAGCTSSEDSSSGTPDLSQTDGRGSDAEQSATTSPPFIVGLGANLSLKVDDCWSALPDPTQSDSTQSDIGSVNAGLDDSTESDAGNSDATQPEPTTPAPLGEPVTTLPSPTIVAQVDCSGTNMGQVFATFCLGPNPETNDPTQPELVAHPCDPPTNTKWPGDRLVRRAAARLCLQRFEAITNEAYAQSEIVAKEFVPTEGIWNTGFRNVVCWFEIPEPDPTAESSTSSTSTTTVGSTVQNEGSSN